MSKELSPPPNEKSWSFKTAYCIVVPLQLIKLVCLKSELRTTAKITKDIRSRKYISLFPWVSSARFLGYSHIFSSLCISACWASPTYFSQTAPLRPTKALSSCDCFHFLSSTPNFQVHFLEFHHPRLKWFVSESNIWTSWNDRCFTKSRNTQAMWLENCQHVPGEVAAKDYKTSYLL